MSSRGWTLWVRDILRSINSIQQCTIDMTLADFEANETAVKAVLYDLMVIPEAAVNVPTEIQERVSELPWRLMGDMRNLIAYEYFRVDPDIVWDTVQNNLSGLIEPLQKLLHKEESL